MSRAKTQNNLDVDICSIYSWQGGIPAHGFLTYLPFETLGLASTNNVELKNVFLAKEDERLKKG